MSQILWQWWSRWSFREMTLKVQNEIWDEAFPQVIASYLLYSASQFFINTHHSQFFFFQLPSFNCPPYLFHEPGTAGNEINLSFLYKKREKHSARLEWNILLYPPTRYQLSRCRINDRSKDSLVNYTVCCLYPIWKNFSRADVNYPFPSTIFCINLFHVTDAKRFGRSQAQPCTGKSHDKICARGLLLF